MLWHCITSLICYLVLINVVIAADILKYSKSPSSCPVQTAEKGDLITCNGKPRPSKRVEDERQVYNMSGRDALQIIGKVANEKVNCGAVGDKLHFPTLSIRYESDVSFRKQAEQAVRIANQMSYLLTRGSCGAENSRSMFDLKLDEKYLYSIARNTFEIDSDVMGAGIIFRRNAVSEREFFAPYSLRMGNGSYFEVRDRSTKSTQDQTNFLQHLGEITQNRTYWCLTSLFTPRKNQTADQKDVKFIQPYVEYIDGSWGRPYFECLSSKAWLVPFAVPFFRINNTRKNFLEFMGVASVDIDLSQVDINQCDLDGASTFTYKIFAGTHHCHNATSKCVHLPGKGFTVGSYKCVCRDGFYFPDKGLKQKYFNGTVAETSFSIGMLTDDPDMLACLRCREGCKTCIDDRPCVVESDENLKYSAFGLTLFCIVMVIGIAVFVWRYRELQVIKSASPLFLLISLLGAALMYAEAIVLYMEPNSETCTASPWLQQLGFILMYGSLLLKTWRVSLIFKIKNAKRVTVSDFGLLQRLAPLVLAYVVLLVIWTVADMPTSIEYKTKDNLKFNACSENWWNHSLLMLDILLLFWGIHLCYTIRKAPTKFNESKFISWSIYNMTVFMIFMKLMKTFLKEDLGPNITYMLDCIRIQLSVTVLVILVFFPKIIRVLKGRGDQAETTSKSRSAGGSSDGTMHLVHENETLKAEITRLYAQLEMMKLAKMEAGNRPMNRADSIASGINSTSTTSLRSSGQVLGSPSGTKSLANGWRNGGSQFFSPAAELVSDFV